MANRTKQQDRDRRAKIEAMRAAERAKERRKSLLFIVLATVVGLGLVAAAAVPAYLENRNDPANRSLSSFGVAASAASCDAVVTDEIAGQGVHVGPGTEQAGKTRVDYADVPPTSGEHFGQPASPAQEFYTAKNRPPTESLVHNLEHGYTVLWYDSTIKGADLDTLKDIATSARAKDSTRGKFIVSAWDDSYGELPEGKRIALSHWGAKNGARQLCGGISGEVVNRFVERFPAADSPEPAAG